MKSSPKIRNEEKNIGNKENKRKRKSKDERKRRKLITEIKKDAGF
jgi:hypothetical protein